MTDDLDRRIGALATAARTTVRVSSQETERALADVTSGAHVTRLRPADPVPGSRGIRPWLAVAVATALVVGGGAWLLTRGNDRLTTVDSTVQPPAPSLAPSTTGAVVTTPSTHPSETMTAAPAPPASTVPPRDPFAGLTRQPTGIARVCYGEGGGCTRLLADPDGVVYSCDPQDATVTRHAEPALGADLVTCPVAIGPGAVAYSFEAQAGGSDDLVARTLGPDDPGKELLRDPGWNLVDGALVPTPAGLATVGLVMPPEPQPDLTRPPAMEWVLPSPDDARDFPVGVFEPGEQPAIVVGARRWLIGEFFSAPVNAVSGIVVTDDGGFLALVDDQTGAGTNLLRGKPDGSTSGIGLHDDFAAFMPALLERSGTVIVPDGDTFVRIDPLEAFTSTTEPPPVSEPPVEPELDLAEALAGWDWEYSGIRRSCGNVWLEQQQMSETHCTHLVIDPQGIPVSYDPLTRVVTRERREGDEQVAFTLPVEYGDSGLLAAGPDDVVYFALDNEWPKSPDVVAISLAPGDAGREIERAPESLPVGDADVFPTSRGLVVSGWYDSGFRPSWDQTPVVPWVGREGGEPRGVAEAGFDQGANLVHANGWQWSIADRTVVGEGPGTTRVVPTFDGGFLAVYEETTGDLRAELIRGWRDGHVEYAELPVSWVQLGGLILEPQGSVLIPNGEWFARLTPFEDRPTGWDGRLEVDVEAGTATPVGLDEYLGTITWPVEGQSHVWPWGVSPVTFANAVAGGDPSSPAELRTIEQGPVDASTAVVTVTTEHFLDDSVDGVRLVMYISLDQPGFRIDRIEWSNACAPERGHQDYQAAYCT